MGRSINLPAEHHAEPGAVRGDGLCHSWDDLHSAWRGGESFKSPHLKNFGPFMIVFGLLLTLLWVLLLISPSFLEKYSLGRRIMSRIRGKDSLNLDKKSLVRRADLYVEKQANACENTKSIPQINISFDDENMQQEDITG